MAIVIHCDYVHVVLLFYIHLLPKQYYLFKYYLDQMEISEEVVNLFNHFPFLSVRFDSLKNWVKFSVKAKQMIVDIPRSYSQPLLLWFFFFELCNEQLT